MIEISSSTAQNIIMLMNHIGVFVFAISGALAGIRKDSDIFGIIVLALATSSFGGIIRDVLIGQLPPALIKETFALFLTCSGAIITYICYPMVKKMDNPIQFFDAIGLGAFAVIGANKALIFGINPVWAVALGVITAAGGGLVRDIFLAQIPFILRREVYATAALLGALVLVIGKTYWPRYESLFLILGAVSCTSVRLYALHKGINLPRLKST